VQLERPDFYCRMCSKGFYPFDEALNLAPGHLQLDVQQAAGAFGDSYTPQGTFL
jgi:hypothetical protein